MSNLHCGGFQETDKTTALYTLDLIAIWRLYPWRYRIVNSYRNPIWFDGPLNSDSDVYKLQEKSHWLQLSNVYLLPQTLQEIASSN